MKLTYLILVVAQICSVTKAQSPCPSSIPPECTCRAILGSYGLTCTPNPGTNVKALLAELEEPILEENFESFDSLSLEFGNMGDARVTIEADSLNKLKVIDINIVVASDLHIDENAFPSTYGYTESIYISNVAFSSDAPPFPFVRKFTKLQSIWFHGNGPNSELLEIPDRAFDNMQNLERVAATDVKLARLGPLAFAGIQKLKTIELKGNDLSLEGIPDSTFSGIGPNARLDLGSNPLMTHLPREKFEAFVDKANNSLVLGAVGSTVNNYLICDDKVNWICDKAGDYKEKIVGYNCMGREGDVFAFCSGALKFVEISRLTIFATFVVTMLQKMY